MGVSRKQKKEYMQKIDELLDIEFKRTVDKIKNDIEMKSAEAVDKIKSGKSKKEKFQIKGFISFTNLSAATLPIIVNEELTWTYMLASGRGRDDLGWFNAFTKKYDLCTFSSERYNTHWYGFRFYKGENFPIFLTKTGKRFCCLLKNYFQQKNIRLKFSCYLRSPSCIKITVECNQESKK